MKMPTWIYLMCVNRWLTWDGTLLHLGEVVGGGVQGRGWCLLLNFDCRRLLYNTEWTWLWRDQKILWPCSSLSIKPPVDTVVFSRNRSMALPNQTIFSFQWCIRWSWLHFREYSRSYKMLFIGDHTPVMSIMGADTQRLYLLFRVEIHVSWNINVNSNTFSENRNNSCLHRLETYFVMRWRRK